MQWHPVSEGTVTAIVLTRRLVYDVFLSLSADIGLDKL